jgi:hypothetical protein
MFEEAARFLCGGVLDYHPLVAKTIGACLPVWAADETAAMDIA